MMIHIDHVVHKREHVMMERHHEVTDIQVVMRDVDHHILTDLLVQHIIDVVLQHLHRHVVIEVGVQNDIHLPVKDVIRVIMYVDRR